MAKVSALICKTYDSGTVETPNLPASWENLKMEKFTPWNFSKLCFFIVFKQSYWQESGALSKGVHQKVGKKHRHIKYQTHIMYYWKFSKNKFLAEHSVMKFLLLGPRALPENSKGAAKTAHIENLSQTISLLNQIPWRLCLDSRFEELGLKSGSWSCKTPKSFQKNS